MEQQRPNVGDIITSPLFAFGYYENQERSKVIIDGKSTDYKVTFCRGEEERVALAAQTGTIPDKEYQVDLSAHSPERGTEKFVVEQAQMQGGSSGSANHNNDYPDGWNVTARKLNADGTYNPEGEVINFYTSGAFTNKIDPAKITVAGSMKKQFA